MKLKKLVLESPLPREVQPTSTTWTEVVPSAQYTSAKAQLDYDAGTGLVTIVSPHSTRCVHVSRVLFMEPAEAVDALKAAAERLDAASPVEFAEVKRRGMPKGGWPKKVPPPLPGALEPPKDPT